MDKNRDNDVRDRDKDGHGQGYGNGYGQFFIDNLPKNKSVESIKF